jgi:hypothetical protein
MYPAILAELPGAPRDLAGADGDTYDRESFPGARRVAREILTLPVAADLMGREYEFLAYLEGLLQEAGALRVPEAGLNAHLVGELELVAELAADAPATPGRFG